MSLCSYIKVREKDADLFKNLSVFLFLFLCALEIFFFRIYLKALLSEQSQGTHKKGSPGMKLKINHQRWCSVPIGLIFYRERAS
jgi:hypothetical protein